VQNPKDYRWPPTAAGFFGIPKEHPRALFCPNVGLFTSTSQVDRLAEAIEVAAGATSPP